jgi:hypothetical protein
MPTNCPGRRFTAHAPTTDGSTSTERSNWKDLVCVDCAVVQLVVADRFVKVQIYPELPTVV